MYMSDISIIVRKMRTFAERNMAHRGIGFPEQLVLMSLLANGESNQESIAARGERPGDAQGQQQEQAREDCLRNT